MRQLIETVRESLIDCDNPKCDYKIPYSVEDEKVIVKYINMPCPKCGENLLTKQDYLQYEKIMRSIRWLNKWFSWTTFFYTKKKLVKMANF